MKTNSYTRIFVLTFLFFSFSAIAQNTHAVQVAAEGTPDFISRWIAAHAQRSSKVEIAGDALAHETKFALATLCTRKYAGEEAH
jgi:hypothetical protein